MGTGDSGGDPGSGTRDTDGMAVGRGCGLVLTTALGAIVAAGVECSGTGATTLELAPSAIVTTASRSTLAANSRNSRATAMRLW